jgi:hypothetical protein
VQLLNSERPLGLVGYGLCGDQTSRGVPLVSIVQYHERAVGWHSDKATRVNMASFDLYTLQSTLYCISLFKFPVHKSKPTNTSFDLPWRHVSKLGTAGIRSFPIT